jgi:hypothetical protein
MFESANIPQQPLGFSPANQVSNIRVEKLLMFETGTYYPQQRRPYVANVDVSNVVALQEKVAESGQGKITASTFSGAGIKFVAPSAQPESVAAIQGGWNQRRFRFIMHVTYNRGSAMGQKFHEILSGWTDRTDLSMQSHHVDPNLTFEINSVTHLRELVANNGAGLITNYVVSDNATLLGNPTFNGLELPSDVSMRPMDVFSHMTLQGADFGQQQPTDARTTITDKAVKSKRANNNPNEYLARIVDNMVNASAVTQSRASASGSEMNGYGAGPMDAVREARRYASESAAINDTVLRALQSHAHALAPQVIFTYQALCGLDPSIHERKYVAYSTPAQPINLHDPSMSNSWDGTDGRTHAAVILSLAIPAIMSDVGITRLDFHAHNHTIGSQLVIVPTNVLSFVKGMDVVSMSEVFKQRLIFEVLNDLCEYGQRSINLIVQSDLAGETVINIGFDGYPGEDFVAPSFCDTLIAPVLTGQRGVLQALTTGMSSLIDSLDGALGSPASAISSAVPTNFGIPAGNPMGRSGSGFDI